MPSTCRETVASFRCRQPIRSPGTLALGDPSPWPPLRAVLAISLPLSLSLSPRHTIEPLPLRLHVAPLSTPPAPLRPSCTRPTPPPHPSPRMNAFLTLVSEPSPPLRPPMWTTGSRGPPKRKAAGVTVVTRSRARTTARPARPGRPSTTDGRPSDPASPSPLSHRTDPPSQPRGGPHLPDTAEHPVPLGIPTRSEDQEQGAWAAALLFNGPRGTASFGFSPARRARERSSSSRGSTCSRTWPSHDGGLGQARELRTRRAFC